MQEITPKIIEQILSHNLLQRLTINASYSGTRLKSLKKTQQYIAVDRKEKTNALAYFDFIKDKWQLWDGEKACKASDFINPLRETVDLISEIDKEELEKLIENISPPKRACQNIVAKTKMYLKRDDEKLSIADLIAEKILEEKAPKIVYDVVNIKTYEITDPQNISVNY